MPPDHPHCVNGTIPVKVAAPPDFLSAAEWDDIMRTFRLSQREAQLLGALIRGIREKDMPEKLGLAPGTIHTYLGRLYLKLNVHSNYEAVAAAFETYAHRRNSCEADGVRHL
jgi:DNA-binding NarL/FixJ family response regulator